MVEGKKKRLVKRRLGDVRAGMAKKLRLTKHMKNYRPAL
jgi:hypothetical protein